MSCMRHKAWVRVSISAVAIAVGTACAASASERADSERKAVHGNDDRMEVYAHSDSGWEARASRSIVALVHEDDIDPSNGALRSHQRWAERPLCDVESNLQKAFSEQPAAAFCGGVVIDAKERLVLTAGRCVQNQGNCDRTKVVFDYYYRSPGTLESIDADDVYQCARIVASSSLRSPYDYAVIQLDRPLPNDREAAPIARVDTSPLMGASLVMMGFPNGHPMKIDDGAKMLSGPYSTAEGKPAWFGANPDTFWGARGSAVFDKNMMLVGMLVRHTPPYRPGEWEQIPTSTATVRKDTCYVLNRVDEGTLKSRLDRLQRDCVFHADRQVFVHRQTKASCSYPAEKIGVIAPALEDLCRIQPSSAPCSLQ